MINKEELSVELWNTWVIHPMTKVMIDLITQKRDWFKSKVYQQLGDKDISADTVRNTVYGMKCHDSMLDMLESFELFKTEINKQEKKP